MTFERDLRDRLADLAESTGSWPDPLANVLARARQETTPAPRPGPRRWSPLSPKLLLTAAAAAAVVIGGVVVVQNLRSSTSESTTATSGDALVQENGGAGSGRGDDVAPAAPDTAADSAAEADAAGWGCGGPAPTEFGPVSEIAALTITAPAEATVGASVLIDAQLTASADGPTLQAGSPVPDVLVVQDGQVVGGLTATPVTQSAPPSPTLIQLQAGTSQLLPQQGAAGGQTLVALLSCPTYATEDSSEPTQTPLPPGDYQLLAVIPYTVDSGAEPGLLVSNAALITLVAG